MFPCVLHHVALEVTPNGAERFAALLEAIGFEEVEPPASLRDGFRWFEAAGTQVHLLETSAPVAPPRGHAAFVAGGGELQPVLDRLAELGFAVEERSRHWGERRVRVAAPDGHRVELMEAPPRRSSP